MTKLFKILLAAIFVARASATVCWEVDDIADDGLGGMWISVKGTSNGRPLEIISWYQWFDGPRDAFYCDSGDIWCFNPKNQRIRACNSEAQADPNTRCANLC